MICIEASLNTVRLPIPSTVYTDKRTIVQDEYRRRNPNWNGEFYFYRAAHPWKEAGFYLASRIPAGAENENFVNRVAEKERTTRDKRRTRMEEEWERGNTRYTRVRSWPRLEPQLEKPVATDSVALTDNNFVCALSSFRRRQAIQLPICRAWWTSFIQPSTVSPRLPVSQVSLSVLPFPFCFVWKIFSHELEICFLCFLFGNGTWNFAASWRNKTMSETLKKEWRKKDPIYSSLYSILFPITSYIYFLQFLNYSHYLLRAQTIAFQKSYFPNSWYTHPSKSHTNLIKKRKKKTAKD